MEQRNLRLILSSSKGGNLEHETVTWTDDSQTPAEDFVDSDQEVYFDQFIDVALPSVFPVNHTFLR
jgi:hypothetical protein